MANFKFTVDTEPMAESINRVSYHVDGVTTAVVAMQTAVIIAEQRAADNVCRNLDNGFYTLIRSQVSQKIARLNSDVNSKTMEMVQQTAALRSIRGRMERDYMMIAARYNKLFNSLNNNLRIRIFELDKYVTGFVTQDIASVTNRLRQFVGTVSTNQLESIGQSQMIASSKTKGLGFSVVESMHQFVADIKQQKYMVSSILSNKKAEKNYDFFIPVVITESVGRSSAQNQLRLIIPKPNDAGLNSTLERNVNNSVMSAINELNWSEVNRDEKHKVGLELNRLIERADYPERIKKQMNTLYGASNWQML